MSLRIGITAEAKELPAALAAFGGTALCRVFGPPGSGIPSLARNPSIGLLREAGVTAWVSFKDWADDRSARAAVIAWLDAIPAGVGEVWLTYHHEPEGDLPSREYRRRWVLLAGWVRAHRNAARVTLVPIHTLYPARHKASDNYHTDWTKWVGVWQQWAPIDGKGNYVGDYMGWDCYQEVAATHYEDPATFFRIPVGAAHAVGAPLVIPELGAIRTATDPTGTGRAGWITACLTYLRRTDVRVVCWWHATGSAGHDYRLTDAASRRAWLAADQPTIN